MDLQTQLNDLWSNLEDHYGPTLTPSDLRTLERLDGEVVDGTLTEAKAKETTTTNQPKGESKMKNRKALVLQTNENNEYRNTFKQNLPLLWW